MDTHVLQSYNEQLTLQFLAVFNAIDKHFDAVLEASEFLPFNEKIKRIVHGHYPLSWFVKLHQFQLRHFGELRNHITHGIKEDSHSYAYPSDHAVQKLEKLRDAILEPPTVQQIFAKYVFTADVTDSLLDVMQAMEKESYTHIPVYDGKQFVGMVTESSVLHRIATHAQDLDLSQIRVTDVDMVSDDAYIFVAKNKNIYEIDQIFTYRRQEGKRLGSILVTAHGKTSEKLLGIITAGDVALVDSYIVH